VDDGCFGSRATLWDVATNIWPFGVFYNKDVAHPGILAILALRAAIWVRCSWDAAILAPG